MAVCESCSCREAGCGAEFGLCLDTFAEESAEVRAVELSLDEVRCVDHPPVDKAGWTLVVYDDGQMVMGPDGVLSPQVWQSGEVRQLWFRTGGRILGPNVPDQAIQRRTAYVANDDLGAVVMSAKEAILDHAESAGWGFFVLAEAIRQLRAEGKLSAGDVLRIVASVEKPKGWRYRPDPYFRAVAPLVQVALDSMDGCELPWYEEDDFSLEDKVERLSRDLPSSFLDPLYGRYPELVMQVVTKSRGKYDYDPEKPLGRAVVERLYEQAREGSPHALVHLEEMGVSLDAWLDQAFNEIMSPAAIAGMWYLSGSRPWPSQVTGMGGFGNNPPAPEKYIRRLVEGLDGLDERAMPGVGAVAFLSAAVELMSKDLSCSFELAKSATRRVVRQVFVLSIWTKPDLPGLADWIAEADIRPVFREAALIRASLVVAGDQPATHGFVLREDGQYAGWVAVKQLDLVHEGDLLRHSEVCPRLHRYMVAVFLSPQDSGEWAEVVTSSRRGYMVAFETEEEGPLMLALEVVTTGRICRDGKYGELPSTKGSGLDEA